MSNTVTNISYANTFGEWMVATNALINENNVLAAGDYTKSSGTIYLNETIQNSLQANGTVIVQKELRVQGTGSSATIDRNMTVGGQVYFTNSTLGLTHTGQANLNGLVLVQGSDIGISVSNNAFIGGNTTIRYNIITNNVQANSTVNTQTLSVTTNSYSDNLIANTQVQTSILSVSGQSYLTGDVYTYNDVNVGDSLIVRTGATVAGVNVIPFLTASFVKANASYDSQNTTGTYANSAFAAANSASLYANGAFIQANAAYGSQNTTGTYANSAFAAANSASLYANGAFVQANAAFLRANTPTHVANSAALYANGAFTQANAVFILANNILTGAQSVANLTLTGTSLVALSAAGSFKSLSTQEGLSVGGSFTINGTTVYNSPTLVLSSSTPNQIIYIGSFRTANGSANGVAANAYIRYNETNNNWEINDVLNSDTATSYSRLLNANTISDSSTSTSTSTVPTSRLVTGLYVQSNGAFLQANAAFLRANTPPAIANSAALYANGAFLQANAAFLVANTPTHVANSAALYANGAFIQANAAFSLANNSFVANSAALYANGAFLRANAAYAQANTSPNTFIGTTGSISQSSGVISFSSNNGLTIVATTANNLAVSTSQDLRTTASPTFAGLTLTTPLALSQGGTGATSAASALTALLPTGATAGYVLTTGGPGNYYWSASGGGGGGGATPGTSINSTRLSYTANGASGYTGNSFTTPAWTTSTQLRAYINGVRQFESEYSANSTSNTISFTTAPSNGDAVLIEVDGYYVNPYYANNIAYTPTGTITGNTIQIAIDTLEAGKAALSGATFTGIVSGVTVATGVSNTAFATTAHVQNSIAPAYTQANTATTNAATADSKAVSAGSYANGAFLQANAAFLRANTPDAIANSAALYANGAFLQANAAFIKANTPDAIANSAALYANGAFIQANAAFTAANNSVSTNSNTQFYSIGVGTAASTSNGEIRATGTITAGYSDDNLKTRLGNIENALDKVMLLNGFYYEPNQTAQGLGYIMKKEVGVSAQEVEKVLPEIVVPAPIDNKYLTIQYEKMVPLLIEAIKELKLEIDALKGNKQ